MKASELIEHLTSLIEKYWDLPVVWMWNDSDYWDYSVDEFTFEKWDLIKAWPDYYYSYRSGNLPTTPVFITNI